MFPYPVGTAKYDKDNKVRTITDRTIDLIDYLPEEILETVNIIIRDELNLLSYDEIDKLYAEMGLD